jgi:hypothetical protein
LKRLRVALETFNQSGILTFEKSGSKVGFAVGNNSGVSSDVCSDFTSSVSEVFFGEGWLNEQLTFSIIVKIIEKLIIILTISFSRFYWFWIVIMG